MTEAITTTTTKVAAMGTTERNPTKTLITKMVIRNKMVVPKYLLNQINRLIRRLINKRNNKKTGHSKNL